MLTKFIVDTHEMLVEVSLWVLLLIGATVGYFVGKTFDHAIAGLLVGAIVTFFNLAILMGAVLTIGQIRSSVRDLETRYLQSVGER